ncbi:EamA family transporter [Pseudonocardiaceae bacterium YIM PH 21723]|nr:EamA family transporter [Pseudonocardiaceae bacterium YIM PH 21723]
MGWAALILVYIVWGSTYLGQRFMVETMPAFAGQSVRYLIAGLLLAALLALFAGPHALAMDGPSLLTCVISGVLLPAWGSGLTTLAAQWTASSLCALLVAGVPLFVVLLRRFFGERPARATYLGVAMGFTGLALLLLFNGHAGTAGTQGSTWFGPWLVILGSLGWSTGTVLVTRRPKPANPFALTAVQMTSGGLALIVFSLLHGEHVDIAAISNRSWWAFGYMIVAAVVALSAYAVALDRLPVSTVATYAYVNPVIAVLLGAVLAGESLSPMQSVGGLVVVGAVFVVVRAEARAKAIVVEEPELVV